ncbi:PTS transporter subunit EIIC [Paratractidigestivibacter sp.]|uniref:PTS transporter subunit EIIC n=1 Tax=Paratractidigestivibacter sp. TaxID=2847316 RepID=UPI002ABD7504|nr:PTS transporter subunit EIIC [Paratractidigestivibacter sp.]
MLQKIQRFGGAMFTPVMLFAFAGTVVGLGTLFTTSAVMGDLAAPDSLWYQAWNVVLQGGWTVFNQLPLLFAVSLPIGLAKKEPARCCMESLVSYLTFNYFVSQIMQTWGAQLGVDFSAEVGNASGLAMVAGIKTLDMGMVGALLISGLVITIHNQLFNFELPECLGVFSGSTFVYLVCFFVMLPVAVAAAFVWPPVQQVILGLQGAITGLGVGGTGLFVFLERTLIPFGLHHILYAPFYYDSVVVSGGIYAAWANMLPSLAATTEPLTQLAPWASLTATGWSKIFGIPGIACAFYVTAKPAKRKQLIALLLPITLTSVFCGVTEPIEFTFLFVAPVLFVAHALLSALLSMCMNLVGAVGVFSGGLIEMSSFNFLPLGPSHWQTYLAALGVGLCFGLVYFVVMRWLILRFDLKTPGREPDEEAVRFESKAEFRDAQAKNRLARRIVELVGGRENIVGVTNCVTRLRIEVRDASLVAVNDDFVAAGARGVMLSGKVAQVIIGTGVVGIKECFDEAAGLAE